MGLSSKIAATVGAGALFIVAVMATLSVRTDLAILEDDLRRDARLVASSVAVATAGRDEPDIRALVGRIDAQSDDIRVRFVAEGERRAPATDGAIRYLAPIGEGGRGAIEVVESPAIAERMLSSAMESLLATSALVILVSLGVGTLTGRQVLGSRIDRLVQKAQEVGQGRFDAPVDVGGDDELTLLATELNGMAALLTSARAHAEAEADARLQAEVRLRHADRLRTVGQLAAGVAHELGTPLNVISGRATLLERTLPEGAPPRTHATVIREQSSRITALVQRLLSYSRGVPGAPEPIELSRLVHETVEMLRPTLKAADVRLSLAQTDAATVRCDAEQLRQIAINLIMNAAQATPGGHVHVSVLGGPPAQLRVEDDGPGIPDALHGRVVEPFFTTKEPGAGTGLGLSIVHAIVEEHGGALDIDRSALGGAMITVSLPEVSA